MRRKLLAVFFSASALFACARALLSDDDAGTPIDSGKGGDSGCAFDTTKDPQHCGSCNTACEAGLVCSASKCSASCQSPTTKCTGDAGTICATLSSDPQHCGQCNTVCGLADAGSMPLGTNNPDAGVPFDGGSIGWSLGTPSCASSTCGVTCPTNLTKCTDGICYDTQNHHEICGSCGTACQSTEWCNSGHCCAQGTEWCGSSCIDPSSDPNNCGGCGKACTGGTPFCSNGTCTTGCNPTGTRQAFNTLSASTVTGCWKGNPCGTDTYSFSQTNGVNYQNVGEAVTCGGTTACVGHVGVNTYTSSSSVCQGTFDVFCDGTKVGSIVTTGKSTCGGSAMTNGCSTTFTPRQCSSIKVQLAAGSGVILCCDTTGTNPDTMLVGVSAW